VSRFDSETIVTAGNLKGLEGMNFELVDRAMAHTPHQRIVVDMDGSESPVCGEQEGAAYDGHFECVLSPCPLFQSIRWL
jgi:peptide methionine sulfoxide reductase MsrB